jgi:hypothetical protein
MIAMFPRAGGRDRVVLWLMIEGSLLSRFVVFLVYKSKKLSLGARFVICDVNYVSPSLFFLFQLSQNVELLESIRLWWQVRSSATICTLTTIFSFYLAQKQQSPQQIRVFKIFHVFKFSPTVSSNP